MKTICVIGAGCSGLTAIKACREEWMNVDCYELSENIGGLWRYHDDDTENRPSVMKTTTINTSKEMTAYSDFPPPKESANYMHNTKMQEYLMMYAERFELLKYIKFFSKVLKVEKTDDYITTGRWRVTVQNLKNGSEFSKVYDGVMVCAGHHIFPHQPHFKGLEDFEGRVIHTHSLKSEKGYEGKKVLVIGIGNSGADAATEVSRVSKKLYLSTRSGSWVISRMIIGGLPTDLFGLTRFFAFFMKWNVFHSTDFFGELYYNFRYDHERYGLKPKHRFLGQHPTVSDGLPCCILSGQVIIKKDIRSFTKNGVIFEGEADVTEIDEVILATGYEYKYHFLSEEVFRIKDNQTDLYKLVFPDHLSHPSLAFIGFIQPFGCITPISEAQCRWYAQLMIAKCRLPSTEEMHKEVLQRREKMAKRYKESMRHTIQVDYVDYMDDICSEFGAKPNLWKLALKDPYLFYVCLLKGCVPYQYRLHGPHAWDGAREAIISVYERVNYPFQSNKVEGNM